MDIRKIACVGAAAFTGALLISVSATPAHAQWISHPVVVTGHLDPNTRVVSYRDLSLNTDSGRKTLMHRVGVAVSEVCPAYDAMFNNYDADWCQQFAWRGARIQLNRAFAAAESGVPLAMSIQVSVAGR